jgi:ATPase subunit of ABC transporter with duplicated ATPase domains
MITHDRYFLDNVVGWILELDRGKYFPYEGNYSTYLEKKSSGSSRRSARNRAARRRSRTSSSGSGRAPRPARPSPRRVSRKFEQLVEKQKNRSPGKAQIVIQVPERLGGKVIEVENISKAMATNCCSRICRSRCRRAASSA